MKRPDYFALLGLERGAELDLAELNRKYLAAQQQSHPDKFVGKPAAEKEAAFVHSSLLNEAFGALRDKFRRLQYLVELTEVTLPKDNPAMLMEIMELREELEENPEAALRVRSEIDELFTKAGLDFKAGKFDDMAVKFIKIKYLNNVIANT